MAIYTSIVTFFKNGGVFMIPIVVILALGTAIAVERWMFLTMTTAKNKALWNAVTPYLEVRQLHRRDAASRASRTRPSPRS